MRNKLSFDLQLSARKAAIAERIAAHKIARSKVSVFLMAMSAGVFMAIGFTFYLSVIADAPSSQALTHLVGGLCFTLGFILLAVCGTSLFTSSVMTVMAKSRGVISWRTWLINALLVACGNLAGIACFSLLIWFSGLVAIVLAYLLEWPTVRLQSIGCSRRWATSIVLVVFVGILLLKKKIMPNPATKITSKAIASGSLKRRRYHCINISSIKTFPEPQERDCDPQLYRNVTKKTSLFMTDSGN